MMLDSLYGFRSDLLRKGLAMAFDGFGLSGLAGQRRMLAVWFADCAILRYWGSPRTGLIGHPATVTAVPATAEEPPGKAKRGHG